MRADEGVYYPLEVEPYTPEGSFAQGKKDPAFRTKLKIAFELVQRAIQEDIPFRAVVADNFYGEDRGLKRGLRELNVPYVMALKPSHAWYHPEEVAGTLQDVAQEAGWERAQQPGKWVRIVRSFRDGSTQDWWAVEIVAGPYGPDKQERAIVATTDPQTLPDLSTWYLVITLPAPTSRLESEPLFPPATLEEIIRLYGLRMWVEQSRHPHQTGARLVEVTGTQRSGHPTALAPRLLRLLLLLVSCQSSLFQHDGRTAEAI